MSLSPLFGDEFRDYVIAKRRERIAKNHDKFLINFFENYQDVDSFVHFTKSLKIFSKKIKINFIGNTTKGREIPVIVLSNHEKTGPKRQILITGQLHAREWQVGPSLLYAARDIGRSKDASVLKMLDEVEIHIVPLVNLDGYENNHKPYLTRKGNAQTFDHFRMDPTNSRRANLNRNFPSLWSTSFSLPIMNPGESAGSEVEVQAIMKYAASLPRLVGSLDVHSYTGSMFYAPGWHADAKLLNDKIQANLKSISDKVAADMSQGGPAYDSKPTTVLPARGDMESWALFQRREIFDQKTKKIIATRPYAFSLELMPKFQFSNQKLAKMLDSAYGGMVYSVRFFNGFVMPESEIKTVGASVSRALVSLGTQLSTVELIPDDDYVLPKATEETIIDPIKESELKSPLRPSYNLKAALDSRKIALADRERSSN